MPTPPTLDELAPEAVLPRLRGRFGRPYVFVLACPSTQRLLPADAPEGAVAVAEEQTAGRGRLGRAWEAPPGTSVLVSVVLRPEVPLDRQPSLTPVAAEACAAAIAEVTGLAAEVKPPNDVLVGGRKVAGVLAEAIEGRVVLGIGVNVNQDASQLPRRPRLPATSLRLELGAPVDRARLLVALLAALERRYDDWAATAGARGEWSRP